MKKTLTDFQRIAESLLADEKNHPVSSYFPAKDIIQQLDLSLQDTPLSKETFLQQLEELALASTKTASSGFFNQLYGGRNEEAILGELLSVLLNTSMYTYKAAGVQVGVEKAVIQKIVSLIGWDQTAGGTFASGGSLTNFMSMLMARDAINPRARFEGAKLPMTVYTSVESHYSIPKNAAFAGIGRDNVRFIPVNSVGEMLPEALDEAITKDKANGFLPVLINCTAGTTVLGAFDNVEAIHEIAKKHHVWQHVDGAYQGAVIFSPKYRHLLKGLENVDSFSFNAHKMINTPLTCSIIMVKNKEHLFHSFSSAADYLFQTEEDDYNPGKISLQCGRRNDALKFWATWKSRGTTGLAKLVEHEFELADFARNYVRNHPDYTLYSFDNSLSVCFNYKGISPKELCLRLYEEAELMVSHGSFNGQEFIRFVTINGQNSTEEIAGFFSKLESFVAKNYPQEKCISCSEEA